jgi:hypothetical protein
MIYNTFCTYIGNELEKRKEKYRESYIEAEERGDQNAFIPINRRLAQDITFLNLSKLYKNLCED